MVKVSVVLDHCGVSQVGTNTLRRAFCLCLHGKRQKFKINVRIAVFIFTAVHQMQLI